MLPTVAEREKRRLALQTKEQTALAEMLKKVKLGASGQVLNLTGHKNTVACLAFSPDGKILASGSGDNTIKLWDTRSGKEIRTLPASKERITEVVFSPDGATLMSSDFWTHPHALWDVASGKQLALLPREVHVSDKGCV